MEDFVIERFVDHKINTSWPELYAKEIELMYHMRLYGYKTDDDKW